MTGPLHVTAIKHITKYEFINVALKWMCAQKNVESFLTTNRSIPLV